MDRQDIVFWQYIITVVLLVSMKIVCFLLGYLTIRLGYLLIASGAKGEFKFTASLGTFKGNLVSVSPGLLFVLLGVILIGYALFVEKPVAMKYGQFNDLDRYQDESGKPEEPNIPLPDSLDLDNMGGMENVEENINNLENGQYAEVNTYNREDTKNVETSNKRKEE
jgi:hypothetical protein